MAWSSRPDVERWFPEQSAEPGDPYGAVHGAIRYAAISVQRDCPACADQSAALRCLREALHWSAEAFRVDTLKATEKPGPNAYLAAPAPSRTE